MISKRQYNITFLIILGCALTLLYVCSGLNREVTMLRYRLEKCEESKCLEYVVWKGDTLQVVKNVREYMHLKVVNNVN